MDPSVIEPLLHGIGSYGPGMNIGPACWPHYDLIVITHGLASFSVGDKSWECPEATALVIPPQLPFQGRAGKGGCTIWVQHFGSGDRGAAGGPASSRGRSETEKIWYRFFSGPWIKALMQRAHELQADGKREDPSLARVLSLLLEALRTGSEPKGREGGVPGSPISDLIAWLESRDFPKPSLAEMAEYVGWSTSHLRREFCRSQGCSLGQFIRGLHMQEAAKLLRESNRPIKEISARLGYADPVAFHRAFVRSWQVTPAKFRSTAPRIL